MVRQRLHQAFDALICAGHHGGIVGTILARAGRGPGRIVFERRLRTWGGRIEPILLRGNHVLRRLNGCVHCIVGQHQ